MRPAVPLIAITLCAATSATASEPVSLPQFSSIQLNGGGTVTVRHGPVQRVTLVSGSRSLTDFVVDGNRRLRIRACARQCPSNYQLNVVIETPNVSALAVHGGGALRLAGPFPAQPSVAVAIHGGGNIDARSASSRQTTAAIVGGGRILAGPATKLLVAITGGGSVRYLGNPQVQSAINGGGSVDRL